MFPLGIRRWVRNPGAHIDCHRILHMRHRSVGALDRFHCRRTELLRRCPSNSGRRCRSYHSRAALARRSSRTYRPGRRGRLRSPSRPADCPSPRIGKSRSRRTYVRSCRSCCSACRPCSPCRRRSSRCCRTGCFRTGCRSGRLSPSPCRLGGRSNRTACRCGTCFLGCRASRRSRPRRFHRYRRGRRRRLCHSGHCRKPHTLERRWCTQSLPVLQGSS